MTWIEKQFDTMKIKGVSEEELTKKQENKNAISDLMKEKQSSMVINNSENIPDAPIDTDLENIPVDLNDLI